VQGSMHRRSDREINGLPVMAIRDMPRCPLLLSTKQSETNSIVITVGDSGPGIAPRGSLTRFPSVLRHQAHRSRNGPVDLPWRSCLTFPVSSARQCLKPDFADQGIGFLEIAKILEKIVNHVLTPSVGQPGGRSKFLQRCRPSRARRDVPMRSFRAGVVYGQQREHRLPCPRGVAASEHRDPIGRRRHDHRSNRSCSMPNWSRTLPAVWRRRSSIVSGR
jgi:hypothetical protein